MAIISANLKIYQCTVWTEGGSHGGDIDTGNEITSGTDQNVFDDVSNDQRVSGITEYRKIYIRNENADTWNAVKMWFSQQTPATNDSIEIKLATTSGTQTGEGEAAGYVSPDNKSHGDVLTIGDLAQNAYQGYWLKRVVTAGGSGYTDNNFIVAMESS